MNKQALLLWIWVNGRKLLVWGLWASLTLALAGYLTFVLLGDDRSLFLPGESSDGHYQIELACEVCHTVFGGVTQEACLACHAEELVAVDDSHPAKKFADPRNLPKLALVDARRCVSCHREHRPAMTRDMGVTLAEDFCVYCHEDIADDRPSHRDLPFDGCRVCHLYHDNSALYEDFLVKHLNEPRTWNEPTLPLRNLLERYRSTTQHPIRVLTAADHDAPDGVEFTAAEEWEGSSHAQSGVNCMACHAKNVRAGQDSQLTVWVERPDHEACDRCHAEEVQGFLAGRHGMRQAQGMSAMHTELARRPMKSSVRESLGCVVCHSAHRFDTHQAAVEACLGCHEDEHSRAYKGSAHYKLWQAELSGQGAAGSGVSCATCHLPRLLDDGQSGQYTRVEHNQNLNLRPNQKMIRSVCLQCHGLGFTLDALADRMLVESNFLGEPARHIESLDMAAKRLGNQR